MTAEEITPDYIGQNYANVKFVINICFLENFYLHCTKKIHKEIKKYA